MPYFKLALGVVTWAEHVKLTVYYSLSFALLE